MVAGRSGCHEGRAQVPRQVAALGSETSPGCTAGGTYDASRPVPSNGCYPAGFGAVVNNGTYTAEWNVLSLGATYHFE